MRQLATDRCRRRTVPAAFLVCFSILLGACSFARLAYDNAGSLLLSRVDSYLRLDDAQRARARAIVDARLRAHRRDELPRTAAWLGDAADALESDLTPAGAQALAAGARVQLITLVERSLGGAATVLASLESAQVDYFESRLAERRAEYADEYDLDAAPGVREAARRTRIIERIEPWTGRLSDAQRERVAFHVARLPDSAGLWDAERKAFNAQLVANLRAGARAGDVESLLRSRLLEGEGVSPELVAARDLGTRVTLEMLVDLGASLDARQRARAVDRLRGFAEDARALAARGNP